MPTPLPALLLFSDYGNDWDSYLETLYQIYLDEIVNAGLTLDGLPVRYRFIPKTYEKGYGFWHLISEGENEDERTPDLRRCERLRWVAWIIANAQNHPDILRWRNRRKSNINVILWLRSYQFAVILSSRSGYYLLTTAYVLKPDREQAFLKEWELFQKTGSP